jgi:hypothetical protein
MAAESVPIVGQLRSYRLGIDLPEGQAHDNFARAARLIHERYASTTQRDTPPTQKWENLDEFYRESNRRQVENTLWMVEQLAGHTWNTWGTAQDEVSMDTLKSKKDQPLGQLHTLGFTDDQIYAMAEAEFEDWKRYYEDAGWQHGPKRDYQQKHHEKLVTWQQTMNDDGLRTAALKSLAGSVIQLREFGYRSRPMWLPYTRKSVSVSAQRRWVPWTWQAHSGETMRAAPGDWRIQDISGDVWSVSNDVFRTSYRRVDKNSWTATGIVLARPAQTGEIVNTREGPERTGEGDWVIQGDKGEQWPVSKTKFEERYQGPVSFAERFSRWKNLHDDD